MPAESGLRHNARPCTDPEETAMSCPQNSPRSNRPMPRMRLNLWLGAWLLSGIALSAQATPEKAAKFYDDALKRYEANDMPGTVIQLKNVLQEDRKMLAAHLLLGKVLLRSGELKAAEAALEEALKQGVSRSEVSIPLGQVYLQLGEPGKLLEKVTAAGLPPAQQAEVLALRGSAQAMTGNMGAAAQSLAEARALDPRAAAPLVAEASMLMRSGDTDKAKAAAARATELAPDNLAAWYMLGTILHGAYDHAGALVAFDKALALNPKYVDARVARAAVLFGLKRENEADLELDDLKSAKAVEPRASYLRAMRAERRGDIATAKAEYIEAATLIDAIPPGVRSGSEPLLMAGALSHRSLGNKTKAREYVETMVARNARHFGAQLLLASMMVDEKEYGRAMPLLENLQRAMPDQPQVLYLMGSIHLARKQYSQATELFERAAARSTATDALRELGISQLGLGQDKAGIASLEKAFEKNPKDLRAGVELAMTYARQGQNDKAVKLADAIVKSDPSNLAMLNFLGNIKGRIGDKRGARVAFEQVVAKDPNFRPGGINLSWLDIEEGRFDPARTRLQKMLTQRKDDPDVLYELGVLEARAKRPDEALKHWQRADEVQRQDPRPGLAMIDLLSALRRFDAALATAKTLVAKYGDNVHVQLAISRAHLAGGDVITARQSLGEATRVAGFDPDQQTLIGRLQLAAGNPDGAAYNVSKALQARPDDLGALVLQVEIEARRRNPAGVDTHLRTLVAKHPGAVPTLLTSANVAMSRGQFPVAQAGYRAAMDKAPSTGAAILLSQAHIAAGEMDKAQAVMQGWVGQHPNDRTALKALAEIQLGGGKNEAARKSYAQLLAVDPEDPHTLGSYAQVLQRLNDPAAVATAEKALKLAPGNPEYLDVLGWILVQRGDLDTGIRHLRDARLRNPNNSETRFHLASALAKAGRVAEARDELAAVLSAQGRAPLSAELQKLKTELGL